MVFKRSIVIRGDSPLYKAIVQAIGEVLSLADQFCEDETLDVLALPKDRDCLTPEQEQTMKIVIKRLDELFKGAAGALDVASAAVSDEDTKKKLLLAAKVVEAIDKDVIHDKLAKLTQEGSCGSCDDILKTVRDSISALESVLTEVMPDWSSSPIFEGVNKLIDFVVPRIEEACEKKQTLPLLRGKPIMVVS